MEIGDAWDQNIFAKILSESNDVQGQFDIVRFLQENCLFSFQISFEISQKMTNNFHHARLYRMIAMYVGFPQIL